MSDESIKGVSGVNPQGPTLKSQIIQSKRNEANLIAMQMSSKEEYKESIDENAFNPLAISRRFETIEKRVQKHGKEEAKNDDEPDVVVIEGVEEISENYENKNEELQQGGLKSLRDNLNDSDSVDDIIRKLQEAFPDHYLADEALNELIRSTTSDSKLGKNLLLAKDKFNQLFQREVRAGRNITPEARAFSDKGIGSASDLRDLYKDVTAAAKEPADLFEELSGKYDYEKLNSVIKFLMQSIGSDMRSKGPSISRPELQVFFNEIRALQAILGIYKFFQSRMNLIGKEFERNELSKPGSLDFETLSKQFVKMLAERYPSVDKILKFATTLGISSSLVAQLIIFTQFRDALRQVSPRLFKNEKQKNDLFLTILDTLSDLEDELDQDEEEEE